jgi:hypothetical protein
MTHIDAPGVIEVVQYFSQANNNAVNVWHVYKDDAEDIPDLAALLDVFNEWEDSSGKALRSNEVTCTGFRATDLSGFTFPTLFLGADIEGTTAQELAPPNATIAIKLNTGFRGRGRQGRVFWVGLPMTSVGGGVVSADYLDAIVTGIGDLNTAVAAEIGIGGLCVLHKIRDGEVLNPYEYSPVVSASYTDQYVDSQKDRLFAHKRKKRQTFVPIP